VLEILMYTPYIPVSALRAPCIHPSSRILRQLLIGGIGTLLILLVGMPASKRVYKTLGEAGNAAKVIAVGDLTMALPAAGQDEIGELMAKIGIMRNNLIELVASVHQNVEAVMHSAGELSAAAHDSASETEAQSEAASSMAAAVEELTVSINQVEEHAREAREIALSSAQQSEEGGNIIHDTRRRNATNCRCGK
jgi:methyl-accepting chemotaxis protein